MRLMSAPGHAPAPCSMTLLIAWPEGNGSFVNRSKKPECLVRPEEYFRNLGVSAWTKIVDPTAVSPRLTVPHQQIDHHAVF